MFEDVKLDHDYFRYYTLQPNDVVVDLGATIGEFAIEHVQKLKEANAYLISLEPDIPTYNSMVQNYNLLGLTKVCSLNAGVWSVDTMLTFNIMTNRWCNMFDIHKHDVSGAASLVNQQQIPVLCLETIMKRANVDHIDFLKVDIEGAEVEIFMKSTILDKIKHFAIAAYHPVGDKKAWEILEPFFKEKGFYTVVDTHSHNGYVPYTLLYCSKEPLDIKSKI